MGDQRQLAAAIGKAFVDVKVSSELRDQVGAVIAADGAKRVARAERFKVPVYDSRALQDRSKPGPRARTSPVIGNGRVELRAIAKARHYAPFALEAPMSKTHTLGWR